MHIVYFGQTPGQGTGSPITMLRHLQRAAAAGHRVSIVGEWGQESAEGWPVLHLPHRRFWWPPFGKGEGWLRTLRMRLWAAECARLLEPPPDAVLTYLSYHSELLSEVAAHYARRARLPLSVIVHDDVCAFHPGTAEEKQAVLRRYRGIIAQAHRTWFVSRELAQAYGSDGGDERVLLPIPQGTARRVAWRETFARQPLVVSAGFLYEQQFPLLARIARALDRAGGRLLLLARETPLLRELCAREPITLQPSLPTNDAALAFVATHAAGFLAAYCERVEQMPWIRSSFPSKVAEFSHLGLPMLFVAPRESAIHRWNEERGVPFNLTPEAEPAMEDFVAALKSPASWEALAQRTRQLAETEFDPEKIQQWLIAELR